MPWRSWRETGDTGALTVLLGHKVGSYQDSAVEMANSRQA